jgi:hypothetical protein
MKKFFKWLGKALLVILGYILLQDLLKKKDHPDRKKVKDLKNKSRKDREKAEGLKSKVSDSDKRRRTTRNKYSKIVSCIVLLLGLLPSSLLSRYIVYDPEDKVNRDYGTITNYVRSLTVEKRELLAVKGHLSESVAYYSNAYVSLSNASAMQDNIIDEQEPSLIQKAKPYGIGCAIGAAIAWLVSLFAGK